MKGKVPKIAKYAALGLFLSPFMAGVARGKSLDDVVDKAVAGRTVGVTVQDDFSSIVR
jgi:hypothetical protein